MMKKKVNVLTYNIIIYIFKFYRIIFLGKKCANFVRLCGFSYNYPTHRATRETLVKKCTIVHNAHFLTPTSINMPRLYNFIFNLTLFSRISATHDSAED